MGSEVIKLSPVRRELTRNDNMNMCRALNV